MGNKKYSPNYIIIILFLLYIFLYRFFIAPSFLKYSESITSVFLILVFILSIIFYGFRNPLFSEYKKNVLKRVLTSIGIYFLIIYFCGLIVGFLSNSYSLNFKSIFNNIFFQALIITMIELFRGNFINFNKNNKKIIILITIIISLFEINLLIKNNSFESINTAFKFLTSAILPVVFRNYMCSYLTYYTDFESSLIYCLIMELYKFIVPIEPDLDNLLISILNILVPFMITLNISRYNYNYEVTNENMVSKKYVKKSDLPFYSIMIILLILVFGIGPYKLVGIKSGSMSPKINVGDAVLIYKNVDKKKLKKDDIIAYESQDKELVVHRIIRINKDGSYMTKGDFNNTADNKFVKFKQIKGIVKFKIPYIAYPAVYFDRR